MLKIPASIYDIFAYFSCGLAFFVMLFIWLPYAPACFIDDLNMQWARVNYLGMPWLAGCVAALFICYLLGLLFSTMSKFIIENPILIILRLKSFWIWDETIFSDTRLAKKLPPSTLALFLRKYRLLFGLDFDFRDRGIFMAYVQKYSPAAYATSFVFLTLYGIYRNLCLQFIFFGVLFAFSHKCAPTVILFMLALACLHGYYRFFISYVVQLANAFIEATACDKDKDCKRLVDAS